MLGEGRVIAGWEKGLEGTCAGEKVIGSRYLPSSHFEYIQVVMVIPSSLGYGDRGAGGVIPGGATLYFITTLQVTTNRLHNHPAGDHFKAFLVQIFLDRGL